MRRSIGLLVLLTCLLLVMTACSQDKAEDEVIEKDTQEIQADLEDESRDNDNQDNEPLFEEELEFAREEVSHTVGAKMPDGYPYDFCPLYEPSEISIAMKNEDEEFIGYTVNLLTKHEVDQVKDFYLGYGPQNTSDLGVMAIYVFEAENDIDYASVTVMENPDEGDEVFETSITISMSLSK